MGAIHANTIEGLLSLVKRGGVGTFQKVRPEYLPLYIEKLQFRYNNRHNVGIFSAAVKS